MRGDMRANPYDIELPIINCQLSTKKAARWAVHHRDKLPEKMFICAILR